MPNSGEKQAIPVRAWPLAGFFALIPPVAAGGAMGMAAIQLIGAAGAPWRNLLPRSLAHWLFLALLAAFLAWAGVTALWSPYPNHEQVWRLSAGVICGLLLVSAASADGPTRRLARATGVGAAAILAVLLLVEAFGGMPLNWMAQPGADPGMLERNPARGTTVLVILIWGVLGALAGGSPLDRMGWRVLLAATAVLSLQFNMAANAAAFVAGLGAYLLGRMAPRFGIIAMSVVLAGILLAAPFVLPMIFVNPELAADLPLSWRHRVEIWMFTCEQIQQKLLMGWGLDASRTFPQTKLVDGVEFNLMPLHPHSASLHVWLETGAIGAVLCALAILTGGVALGNALKNQPAAASAACGVMGVALVIDNVSFGAWQEWWIATTFAGAALAAAAWRKQTPVAAVVDDDY